MNKADRILITGASGLAGTWLHKALVDCGVSQLFCLDCVSPGKSTRDFTGSITDPDFVHQVISTIKPTHIFHLAGLVGHKPLDQMIEVNEQGTGILLDTLRKKSLTHTRVLITSSSSVYGDKGKEAITEDMDLSPASNYSISKVRQEETGLYYFSQYGIPVVISRAFNNIAPGEKEHMFISRIASQIAGIEKGNPGPLKIGPLHSYRDYLDTRDVVDGYITIMEKGVPGEVYNVCSGEPVKIHDLFLFLIKNACVPVAYEEVAYDQKGNIPYQYGSAEKLKSLTGWRKKRDIYKTLLEILDYWRDMV